MKRITWVLSSIGVMLLVNMWMDWYMTFVTGALLALVRNGRPSGLLAFASGALGWGGPILFMSSPDELLAFTEKIGGAFGLSGGVAAAAVLLLPFLLGGLLAVCGSWIVRASEKLMGRSVLGRSKTGRTAMSWPQHG